MPNFDDLFSSQPVPQGDEAFNKDAWAAKKQQEREQVYDLIDTYARDMGSTEGLNFANAFQTYLDVQARFDRYSVSNAILIAAQMPEATRLADFDAWKDSGVYVRRGAEAITILEPGKEYKRQEDGSTGVFYNPKKVFDIHYNFIGVLDMPEVEEYPDNVVLDSRQGVAVEYLVGKAG